MKYSSDYLQLSQLHHPSEASEPAIVDGVARIAVHCAYLTGAATGAVIWGLTGIPWLAVFIGASMGAAVLTAVLVLKD
jgi:hypothetical protein